jgi:8-oxo-dGTP diphosphatase
VLVVEGAARAAFAPPAGPAPAAAPPPGRVSLEVRLSPGHGDDTIVEEAAARRGPVLVITADRELRARVAAVGASSEGPRWLWSQLDASAADAGRGPARPRRA